MSHRTTIGLSLITASLCALALTPTHADVADAIKAMKSGDYETAYEEFSALADQGDAKAMVTLGMFFYKGEGFPQDYDKAMDWFLRAMALGNGDAYNNIGVMFRDGLGVAENRAIAYDLFLIVHMRGLGNQSTQYRANRNLRREVSELSNDQIRYALCLSETQVLSFVKQRGKTQAHEIVTSGEHIAIKDREWWLDGEMNQFEC